MLPYFQYFNPQLMVSLGHDIVNEQYVLFCCLCYLFLVCNEYMNVTCSNQMLRTHKNSDVFNTLDEIYLVFTKNK